MLPLVCIDVDGTLVGRAGSPTAGVWHAAAAAVARGQRLAITTARGAFGPTADWARRLDPSGWHIFHAGAALVHLDSSERVTRPLPTDVVDLARTSAATHGWTIEYYSVDDYRAGDTTRLAVDHAALMGVPHALGGPEELDSVVRVQMVVPHDQVAGVRSVLADAASVSSATSPIQRDASFVSVTAPGVSKVAAISELCRRLGTDLDRVMMIGDSDNDLDAVAAVGHGTAMGNAAPEVRAAARHHVADVEADGVAEALALSASL